VGLAAASELSVAIGLAAVAVVVVALVDVPEELSELWPAAKTKRNSYLLKLRRTYLFKVSFFLFSYSSLFI
jgi:hypothetical protein